MTAKELLEKMERLNINQARLAERLDVTRQQVHNWMTGKTPVPRTIGIILDLWIERLQQK